MRAILVSLLMCASRGLAAEPTFPADHWTLTANTAYAMGLGDPDADLASVSVGANYFVIDNLSLGLEISGLHADQSSDDAFGGGLSAVLRHHFFDFDGTTIFFDVMSGPVQWSRRVPEGGTHFNFITRAGIGATHKLNDDFDLMGGARYFHMSNARIEGDERNPSVNGIEFYIGVVWHL